MLTGVRAEIKHGYTGWDHLIDSQDESAAMDAVAGQSFRRSSDALRAASVAYRSVCDRRVRGARILVTLRGAYGDVIEVG